MKSLVKSSRSEIRRMIARAAWNDKRWMAHVAWQEANLQQVRGYIECLYDMGVITLLEWSDYDGKILHIILKINKML